MKYLFRLFYLVVFSVVMHCSELQAQCMSGTYTVGGTSPNYPTLTAAINDLTLNGVCGPVLINLRNGTYNEQVSIGAITGVSSVNTVTIQGENGASSVVNINYPSSSLTINNYVIDLNGSSWITFRYIKIERTGSSQNAVAVHIRNGSANITFSACTLKTQVTSSTALSHSVVRTDISAISKLTFTGNTVQGGSKGIYIEGSSTIPVTDIAVNDNSFSQVYSAGITLMYVQSLEVTNNTTSTTSSSFSSVQIMNCSGDFNISGNNLVQLQGNGIFLTGNTPTSSSLPHVFNNMISCTGASGTGIVLTYNDSIHLYHNSIYSAGNGVVVNFGSGSQFINNCIYASKPVNYSPAIGVAASNYNNLVGTAATGAYMWNGTGYNTFNAYRLASGLDSASISVNPLYVSTTDLHINNNIYLNDKGTYIPAVSSDYDGQARNTSTPDIGADEFSVLPDNAAMQAMIGPSFPVCPGANNINIRFRNPGSNALTSLVLNWKVNNVTQASYNWAGNIAPGDTSPVITIGSYNFIPGQVYNLKIWTSLPNGVPDTQPGASDTLSVNNGRTRMAGIYTIGGLNPNYTTFTAAAADLALRGVCAPVTFNVRNGTYLEKFTIGNISGASSVNRITFQGENQDSNLVVVTYGAGFSNSVPNYIVYLNGAKYITFRHMTLQRTPINGSYFTTVIRIASGTKDNRFENTVIRGTAENIQYNIAEVSLVYAASTASLRNDSIIFINNRFINGSYAIYMNRSTSLTAETGAVISRNIFTDQTKGAVYITNQTTPVIIDNLISSNRDTVFTPYAAIDLRYGTGEFSISGNRIAHKAGTGINLVNCTGTAIARNRVINNFISNREKGISLAGGSYTNIQHNSVNTTGAAGVCFAITTSNNLTLQNNIFANTGNGKVFAATPTGIASNYNNLYHSGPTLSSSYSNLAAWQATGQDTSSVSTAPGFYSPSDLHILYNPMLDSAGVQVQDITRDIDGEFRDSIPDIGADEFSADPIYDIGVLSMVNPGNMCNARPGVRINVKNYGTSPTDTIYSFKVYTKINNQLTDSISWNGILLPGDTLENMEVSNYLYSYGTTYQIKVWTSLPNYSIDTNAVNDTLNITPITSMGGTYTIGGIHPDFNTFNEAKNVLYAMGVCDSVTFLVSPGLYSETLTFTNPVPASNPVNTITFTSLTGDSSGTVIRSNANTGVIVVNNAPYIRIKKLKIQQEIVFVNNVTMPAVVFGTGSDSCALANNFIVGSVKNAAAHGLFSRNYIMSGNLHMIPAAGYKQGNKLLYNTFYSEHFDTTMIAAKQDHILIEGNYMLPLCHSGTKIKLRDCVSGTVTNNRLYNLVTGGGSSINAVGITVQSSSGTISDPILVSNNMISLSHIICGQLSSNIGIESNASNYVNVYHNTVLLDSICSAPANNGNFVAFRLFNGSNVNVMNNIFLKNLYSGLYNYQENVIWVNNLSALGNCDYNLYSHASNFTYTTNMYSPITFQAWQTYSGKDQNSQIGWPEFLPDSVFYQYASPTTIIGGPSQRMHFVVPELNQNVLQPYRSQVFYSSVNDDVHNDVRDTLMPMIGADEYPDHYNNASIVAAANFPCSGVQPLDVVVANFGYDTLTSVSIGWMKDNVAQPVVQWTGSILPGDSAIVNLGSHTFPAFDSLKLKAWTFLPNGQPDPYTLFDTLATTIHTALGGAYTIGGTAPDFSTFNAAVAALHLRGVCSAVTFNVRSGTYNERIVVNEIRNASPINTITFQSEALDSNAVLLTNAPNAYGAVVYLRGTDHIRFNKLWIRNTTGGSGNGRVVLINGKANDIIFTSNVIQSPLNSGMDFDLDDAVFIGEEFGQDFNNNDILFKSNYIKSGNKGFHYKGNLSAGIIVTSGIRVIDNVFEGQLTTPVSINITKAAEVRNNVLRLPYSCCLGYGIHMGMVSDTFKVENNTIDDVGIWGIYLNAIPVSSGGKGLVANNSIYRSNLTNSAAVGIMMQNTSWVDIMHNSINIASNPTSVGKGIHLLNSDTVSLINNMIVNSGGGYALYIENSYNYTSNFNNLYTTGTNLGYLNTTSATSLSAWQTLSGQDQNSISANPGYVSSNDLHFTSSAVENMGAPVVNVTKDKQGNTRSTITPDIGCYETYAGPPQPHDAAMSALIMPNDTLCSGQYNISVAISNPASQLLSTVDLQWKVNGVPQPQHSWTGWLSPYAVSSPVTIGSYNFSQPGVYNIQVWTTNPNGTIDPVNSNDTLVYMLNIKALPVVNLGADTTICANSTLTLSAGSYSSYLWSTGAVTPGITTGPGLYSVQVTDANGCSGYDTIAVSMYATPPVNLGADTMLCTGATLTLNAGSFSAYQWSNGATSPGIIAGSGTYSVWVTDANGCTAADTINIGSHAAISVSLGADTMLCTGATLTLNAGSFSAYQWSNGATSPGIIAGSGTYSVWVTDANGCTAADTINIGSHAAISVSLGADTMLCTGATLTLNAGNFSAYQWSNGATTSSVIAGGGIISVQATDSNGCVAADTINIGTFPAITLNLGADTALCPGESITLNAGSFNSYQWSNGFTSSAITAVPGTYFVNVTDTNNCTASDTILISSSPGPVVSLGADTSICTGSTLALNAGSFASYQWSDGSSAQGVIAQPGIWWVEVTNASGCTASDTISVTADPVPPMPLITQSGDTLYSSEPAGNQWYLNGNPITGATSQSYVPVVSGNYSVIVTNAYGCSNTSQAYNFIITGAEEVHTGEDLFRVYPNPVTGFLNIVINPGTEAKVMITDSRGQLMDVIRFDSVTGEKVVDCSSYSAGVYHVQLVQGSKVQVHKVVKLQ